MNSMIYWSSFFVLLIPVVLTIFSDRLTILAVQLPIVFPAF
jgi:hypothetical protein